MDRNSTSMDLILPRKVPASRSFCQIEIEQALSSATGQFNLLVMPIYGCLRLRFRAKKTKSGRSLRRDFNTMSEKIANKPYGRYEMRK